MASGSVSVKRPGIRVPGPGSFRGRTTNARRRRSMGQARGGGGQTRGGGAGRGRR